MPDVASKVKSSLKLKLSETENWTSDLGSGINFEENI